MFQKLLKKIAKEFSKHKIPYMVIGGHAVLVYGEPRLTRDIDVTIGLDVHAVGQIQNLVSNLDLVVLVKDPKEFVRKTMVLPALEKKSGIRVDFIFSNSVYEKLALQKARKIKIGGSDVFYASMEDVIIHKIVAGRPRDLEDVRGILVKNSKYDAAYIKKWLTNFDKTLDQNFVQSFVKITRDI